MNNDLIERIEAAIAGEHSNEARAQAAYSAMQGEVGGLREAVKLAMQALSAFGDTEEGVTTAYNILKDAVQ